MIVSAEFYGIPIVELFSQDIHGNSQRVWDTMVDGVMVSMVSMVSHGIGMTGSILIYLLILQRRLVNLGRGKGSMPEQSGVQTA
jgi:hypothetical protein